VHRVASTTLEGRKFASTDASVMQGLPVRLREEFTARLLQGDAVWVLEAINVWNGMLSAYPKRFGTWSEPA
jgi:hypothetical protein